MTITVKRLPSVVAALLAATGLALTGCSSDDSGSSSSGAVSADSAIGDVGGAGSDQASTESLVSGARPAALRGKASGATPDPAAEPAIIQTGTLTVGSDDVAAARFDLDKILDAVGGSVADEKTTADDDGGVSRSRVQVRVPSDEFDAAMTGIGELGGVTQSTRQAEDVTGQVIDTQARVRAQEQSLERIEVLFGRAEDIADIVSIEAQLSRRQADLDSLKGQLAYLQDQTTLSTITVYLEQTQAGPAPVQDRVAFVDGLSGGWQALARVGSVLATTTGALLPFALLLGLLGVPAMVVARRLRTRPRPDRPAQA